MDMCNSLTGRQRMIGNIGNIDTPQPRPAKVPLPSGPALHSYHSLSHSALAPAACEASQTHQLCSCLGVSAQNAWLFAWLPVSLYSPLLGSHVHREPGLANRASLSHRLCFVFLCTHITTAEYLIELLICYLSPRVDCHCRGAGTWSSSRHLVYQNV